MSIGAIVAHSTYQTLAGAVVGCAIDVIFPSFSKDISNEGLLLETLVQAGITAIALFKVATLVQYKVDDPLDGMMYFIAGYEVQEGFHSRMKELGRRMRCTLRSVGLGATVETETS